MGLLSGGVTGRYSPRCPCGTISLKTMGGLLGMASAPPPTITRPDLDEDVIARLKALPPYKVVVLDCQCHTFDDVERALCRIIPGMTRPKAHQHAWEIHT